VVMVGRGAQFFLPAESCLRVRLVAPLEWRAKRVARHDDISIATAKARLQKMDDKRAAFVWRHFHQRVDSPLNYELVINTAETGLERATAMVVWAVEQKFRLGESGELTREMRLNRDANIAAERAFPGGRQPGK